MTTEKTCPACGSDDLQKINNSQVIKDSFGGSKIIEMVEYKCNICESSGDFFDENVNSITEAIDSLNQESIVNIINDFSENKISMSSIERALDIPQRTLTKWKNGIAKPTSTGIALLKFIRLFPWLLDVAESKFDYNAAQKICIDNSIRTLLSAINFEKEKFFYGECKISSGGVHFYFQIESPNDASMTNFSCLPIIAGGDPDDGNTIDIVCK